MASSGNNPFDTLAGTRNNTLTQTTVSAFERDTDHIQSTRDSHIAVAVVLPPSTPSKHGYCMAIQSPQRCF